MKRSFFFLCGLSAVLVSCESKKSAAAQAPLAAAMPAARVSFVKVASEAIVIRGEFPARVSALRVAQVRARVAGVLQKRTFEEGGYVKMGQLLFEIDPEPLRAVQASAKANLLRAQAAEKQAVSLANRLAQVKDARAVRQQDVDDAQANVLTAKAGVLGAEASLKTADLNLEYARVVAPIAGQTSRALVTEGALVGQGDATELVRIEQISRVFVDFTQSNAEVQAMKKALATAGVGGEAKECRVLLDDGAVLPKPLVLKFSEMSVDVTTAQTAVRGEMENEKQTLLPGMFVRVSTPQQIFPKAMRVPMQAVSRDATGKSSVFVVTEKDEMVPREVEIVGQEGADWIVTAGLSEGARVVMEGQMKARPGSAVKAEAYQVPVKK